MAFAFSALLAVLLFSTQQYQVSSELSLEEGYTVTTVLDANKLSQRRISINPSSILPRLTGGFHDVVVLDSPNSVFYTISFPISQDSDVRRYSGNETSGFADGDLGSARFDRPRNFAVDLKGNIYVADKTNHAIRKITKSGVTTIAGGHSGKPGNADGPAQYASFSEDFELAFVPEACALLISDRGNRLIRQMNLKPNDCGSGSPWKLGASGSVLLGVSCLLLGSAITVAVGLIAFPSITTREVVSNHRLSEIWKRCCQTNLERLVMTVFSDIKSAVASSTIYLLLDRIVRMSLSHLSLMFGISIVQKQTLCREQVSLPDSDVGCNHETTKSPMFADQLKDLITYDENVDTVTSQQDDEDHEESTVLTCRDGSIDAMIHANILEFANQSTQKYPLEESLVSSSGLLKRK